MIRTQMPDCDALIVGAGMVGSACALALARQGLDVSVIDRDHLNQNAEAEPKRVSAINLASENILKRLEVWDEILASLPQTFERIEVQDEGSSGTISFDAADLGLTHLGHIISNEAITRALHYSLDKEQRVSLRLGQATTAIASSDSSVTVTLETGEMISRAF